MHFSGTSKTFIKRQYIDNKVSLNKEFKLWMTCDHSRITLKINYYKKDNYKFSQMFEN